MGLFDGVPSSLQPLVGAGVSLLEADAYSLVSSIFGTPSWGIFFYGIPVVVADSVVAFDLSKNWTISDFPVEDGSFASYNKVFQPFRGTFRFVAGGSEFNRQLLLASIEAISGDLNQYDIVTPEMVYPGVNVVGYDYRRTGQSGAGLVAVDVKVEQVKTILGAVYTSTAAPESAAQANVGPVQAQAPAANVPPATAVAPLSPVTSTPLGN